MPGSSLYAQQRLDDEVMPKEVGRQQEKASEPINPTREVKEAAKFFYLQGVKKAEKKDYAEALEDLKKSYRLFPNKKIKTQIDKLASFLDKQTTPDIEEDRESLSTKKTPFIDKLASFFVKNASFTTSSHEHPHFRIRTPKAKVIPGEKVVTQFAFLELFDIALSY